MKIPLTLVIIEYVYVIDFIRYTVQVLKYQDQHV